MVREGDSTRFTLHAPEAEAVELCLFDSPEAPTESRVVPLVPVNEGAWEVLVEGVETGDAYGYRVHGPWIPEVGHRFNAAKLLADPRALALTGDLRWDPALRAAEEGHDGNRPSSTDSAPFVPRSVVVDREFDWQGVERPATPWGRTLLYECHIKGMTRLHEGVPPELRGTYLGLVHPPVIEHLLGLGVTAVELLPVQHSVRELHLAQRGLTNYFGYNPLGFFAPHEGYATAAGRQVEEFKIMVRELHRAGLEVILDVVFNHTAEGDHTGPSLSLRGIANRLYYRLVPGQRRYYENYSGCGNTLDFGRPETVELTLDCLRYWVEEMGVDGFRFDLAPVLGRQDGIFVREAPLLRRIGLDPILKTAKLIAEPWDLGPGGYLLGAFPAAWSEWNDRFRDSARSFWRGERGSTRNMIEGLTGSSGIFGHDRPLRASVNLVTAHDGFTLRDLVSYQEKHNQANGEENRDGHDHNSSRNWGVEGPTARPEVLALRDRARRNLMITLALSHGVPMIAHGDEIGRTQLGNNNAYCQDNEITWMNWSMAPEEEAWLDFVRGVFSLRRAIPALQSDERPGPADFTILDLDARPFEMPGRDEKGSRPAATPSRDDLAFAALWRGGSSWVLALFNGTGRTSLFRLPAPRPSSPRTGPVPIWRPVAGSGGLITNGTEPSIEFRRSARLEPLSLLVLRS